MPDAQIAASWSAATHTCGPSASIGEMRFGDT